MYPVLRRFRSAMLVAALCLLAIALFSGWSHLSAQTNDPEQPGPSDLTEAMRRFLENRKTVVEVPEAMGATPCVSGMAGPYPCENVDLMAFIPVSTFSAPYTNDIWGWTDPMDGKEYVLLGLYNGTAFVDITDPVNPLYLGKLPTHTGGSFWRDVKVYNNYAFIVSDLNGSHGMQIFDLTELRSVVSPPVTFSETNFYGSFGSAHNVAINEDSGYAYAVGTSTCSGGLHIVNIQDPLNVTNAGCFSADGYTHDAECVDYAGPDPDYAGAEVCFNSNEDTLTIVDVTNKAAPAQISRTTYTGSWYTHQGWLLNGQRYFLLGDEDDESHFGHNTRTYIWDLLDLDNPQLIGNYTGPNASIDHNLYIVGNFAYESNYTSGLQILDLSDVSNANLSQVAYFDTYPSNNAAGYYGSWSNYPYFESGNIAVTGIDEGLFILKPTIDMGILQTNQNTIEATVTMGQSVTRTLTVTNTGTISFSFTVSEGATWASVSPSGGTLDPNQSMDLSVVLDSSATAGPGDYMDMLTFSGTYNNNPGDIDLILHVLAEADHYIYLPIFVSDQGGNAASSPTAVLPWLLPLAGITVVVGIGRKRSGK